MLADQLTAPVMDAFRLLTTRQVLVLSVALCALVAALAVLFLLPAYARQNTERSRVLRVEEQRYAQAANRLQAARADDSMNNFDTDLNSTRLSLLEALEQLPEIQGVLTVRYELQSQPFIQESSSDGRSVEVNTSSTAASITRLRISIQLRLLHSAILVDVLDRIRKAAESWPLEVRACELQRTAEQAGIDVQCAIDVVHWATEADAHG